MKPILILYATREGHTRKVAEFLADRFRQNYLESEVMNAAEVPEDIDLSRYSTAVLAASVHVGKHEPEMVAFAKRNRELLERMRAAFLSVSATQVAAEDLTSTPKQRETASASVKRMIDQFILQTGWTPSKTLPVAGALKYRDYNLFVRLVIRIIARCSGKTIDTSQNTEYTNWKSLESLCREVTADISKSARSHASVAA